MAFSSGLLQQRLKLVALCISLLATPGLSIAASDSARVISTQPEKAVSRPAASSKAAPDKATPEKANVLALINLEEVMPDCQQQVAKVKIKSVQRSESGITTESITFSWSNSNVTLPTHMSDNPVLTLDDLLDATRFIKVGSSYFIHFQTCEHTQERSLINIYAL
ncbi:hypothetical protein [Methylophilus sp.]|uniref:hypothetical protein n=1 Tax=Methylophilus sp. TaxID=29541 RepID=UPI0040375558